VAAAVLVIVVIGVFRWWPPKASALDETAA
jgi:hypothetical protein